MYKISEHKDEIITSIISNSVWYVITILVAHILLWVPFVMDFFRLKEENDYKIPIYSFVLAGISVILMFVISVVLFFVSIKLYKKTRFQITTDLIFQKLEIELYFKDRKNIFSYLTYDCIVNKEGYEEFKKSLIWTGGKYNYTKIIEADGTYALSDSSRKASPHVFFINFNKRFSVGEKLYFKLETSVVDNDLSMTPVFSHMIKQQTNEFIIHLTVPKDLVINVRPKLYKDIERSIEVANDITLTKNNVGELIQYSFSVKNPKLLDNYAIEWNFK